MTDPIHSQPRPAPFSAFAPPVRTLSPLRRAITAATRRAEVECIPPLLAEADLPETLRADACETARRLVEALRARPTGAVVEGLVREYALSSQEGVALMCLAEALLRIPDTKTRDALIRDKLAGGDWKAHLGGDVSPFVNAATWGLVVTGRLVESHDDDGLGAALTRLIARAGEPVIRRGVDLAMRLLGEQFVTGRTIGEALARARAMESRGFTHSYDMLGEAAATAADAARYRDDYEAAIHAIGAASAGRGIYAGPGVSIKLSALHPRYSRAQAQRIMDELLPCVKALAMLAKRYDIGFNIDAEEADRLELSLDLIESLALDPDLAGWDGLGCAVQAYGKRCPFVIDWIVDLARRSARRIMVRLVKGAYWDAEIKRAQVDGQADFPVYTRKIHSDVAYIACARKLLDAGRAVFPQFATHNARTLATIHHMAGPDFRPGDYEYQCLHGMGEALYEEVVGPAKLDRPCRIYAPVGTHETLLAYLVRRLLENGANSSFVNRIADPLVPVEQLVADPVARVAAMRRPGQPHDLIRHPAALFDDRLNSAGLDLGDEAVLEALSGALGASVLQERVAVPMIAGLGIERRLRPVRNPADLRDVVGMAGWAVARDVRHAARVALTAAPGWAAETIAARSACLERAADRMQAEMPALLGLIVREAGKSVPNAIGEVREAIDFLRYYAAEARRGLVGSRPLGPVACISPWNFPLAIFTGQIAAALVAGNTVLAKPAEETPLIAAEAVRILHGAGVPPEVLQLIPGDGEIGAALVGAPETAGVLFTGSTEVARAIARQLAGRLAPDGQPVPLVAETGGQNAMIVDSSALAEQVVADVIASAFDSAGQRCSALRILCVQEDVADSMLAMLKGALDELDVGSVDRLAADVGPVITAEAKSVIEAHVAAMRERGHEVHRLALGPETRHGHFVAPTIIEIERIADVPREVFGPVLHVLRYHRDGLDALVDAINATGYGLTFGLHTRLDSMVGQVLRRVRAGNVYVNRNMIGAVVGVQPFGGHGLSGTGPKAGGPLYLRRLVRGAPPMEVGGGAPDPGLRALAGWLEGIGEGAAARLALSIGAAVPVQAEVVLPGPVGERNSYRLRARGAVGLMPISVTGLANQLAVTLATGNDAVIAAEGEAVVLLERLPPALAGRVRQGDAAKASAILVEGDPSRTLDVLQAVAAGEGAIVRLLSATSAACARPDAYRAEWLFDEQSVSTNTTAAGGNASLMSMA